MIKNKKLTAVILAAGSSTRFGPEDKLCENLGGRSLLIHTVEAFSKCSEIDEIILVFPPEELEDGKGLFYEHGNIRFVAGGKTRPRSSVNGITAATGDIVLIHDGARPFVTADIILRCAYGALQYSAAAAAVQASDTIKITDENGVVRQTTDRPCTWHTQTPQAFERQLILDAYAKTDLDDPSITDDCMIAERQGIAVHLVEGDKHNIKVTTKEDMILAEAIARKRGWKRRRIATCCAIGQDSHRMSASFNGRSMVLGGVEFPDYPALEANSDGDVVLHALTNAISGITGKNVLGARADALCRAGVTDSRVYLQEVLKDLQNAVITHVSFTIECLKPHLSDKIDEMKASIGDMLSLAPERLGITATTGEKLTSFGRGEGISVFCIITVEREEWM